MKAGPEGIIFSGIPETTASPSSSLQALPEPKFFWRTFAGAGNPSEKFRNKFRENVREILYGIFLFLPGSMGSGSGYSGTSPPVKGRSGGVPPHCCRLAHTQVSRGEPAGSDTCDGSKTRDR